MTRRAARSTLFPYTTLFRSAREARVHGGDQPAGPDGVDERRARRARLRRCRALPPRATGRRVAHGEPREEAADRSEEHTSELQSRLHLVCRLLLEKKKNTNN